MSQTERREICYLRSVINSEKLEFTWSIITPSTWDWIGLYEDDSKSNKEWLNGHWFYISNHIATGRLFLMINYILRGLQHTFDRHKEDWDFSENDHWNNQNKEKLQRTLQEFIYRNVNNVYSGSYKNQDAYFIGLSDKQYNYVIQPPFKLRAVVLMVYEDILDEIANSEVERDDLLKLFLKVYLKDKNSYSDKVYDQIADFFELAESYIPLSFEGREKVEPEDNYELDYEKIKEKAKTILGVLEKSAI
ncbi:hypothetical protein C1645_814861 [Glomus cerebriforme]|uniref:Colicin D C-terminal domain-containing protein n=1 Tax=Glomus cerebriforme TaxID=658196 RepID=A0A397TIQ5_9GLOM|nr:hypothetical protein C1645_814861 [Glomus cerebriforme]